MKSLKAIRVGQNLTQQEVARKAGLSQPAYSNIENGERMPSVETAKRIGAVLGGHSYGEDEEARRGAAIG